LICLVQRCTSASGMPVHAITSSRPPTGRGVVGLGGVGAAAGGLMAAAGGERCRGEVGRSSMRARLVGGSAKGGAGGARSGRAGRWVGAGRSGAPSVLCVWRRTLLASCWHCGEGGGEGCEPVAQTYVYSGADVGGSCWVVRASYSHRWLTMGTPHLSAVWYLSPWALHRTVRPDACLWRVCARARTRRR
jgi:hypothetical protein